MGFLLSGIQASKVVVLLLVLPTIIQWGRPLYVKTADLSITPIAITPVSNSLEPAAMEAKENVSSHFDVHLVFGSWSIEIIVLVCAALAVTKIQYFRGN